MPKTNKTKRSRFDGLTFDQLNEDAAALTQATASRSTTPPKRTKGRPKTSNRKPFNTALDPAHKQRLEVLAMLRGGSVADQLDRILAHHFASVEPIDDLLATLDQQRQPPQ